MLSHLVICFPEPFPVSSVGFNVLNVSAMSLNWFRPMEYHNGFSYQVLVSNCTENSRNLSTSSESITVQDLQPGTMCQFSVYSLACGILGEPKNISALTSMYSNTHSNKENQTQILPLIQTIWVIIALEGTLYFLILSLSLHRALYCDSQTI